MVLAVSDSIRLDNAANIYPASLSKHYASLYRMRMTLTEIVDVPTLQHALERVSERIPSFRCGLKAGAFWWYLKKLDTTPEVLPLKGLSHFRAADQKGLLYRVSAVDRQIVLDVFHALADGHGALTFLATLTGEYLRLRHGIGIGYNDLVLNPADTPLYAELEDSFKTVFGGRKGQLEQNEDAYHIRGDVFPAGTLLDLRVVMPMDRVREACRTYSCTVTELLVACQLMALQEEHRRDPNPLRRSVLKVSLPVNLRPMYGSRTLRNFSSYVNLGVNVKDGYKTFAEVVKQVRAQKTHLLYPENLEPKIAANVALEENPFVCCLPLLVKHPTIDIINRLHGDRFCSQTLSNLGQIRLPEALQAYVESIDFMLGRQRGNSGACSCLGYNGKLYLHLSRKVARDSFEQALLRQLRALGIPSSAQLTHLA